MDNELDWRTRSQCSKLSPKQYDAVFFPPSGRGIKRAKLLCNTCEVRQECLQAALDNDEEGIWAGTLESERRKMKIFQVTAVTATVRRRKNIRFY